MFFQENRMPKTRINCPNCRQPIVADIDQLLDVGADPEAKQRMLSGTFNLIQCPHCGYQGNLPTPLVYHDPEKELLLTYVPPEMALPRDDQERMLGSLINQAVNRLAPEQRKGYLLRPQAHLTMQSLVERVLEGEGITREMIQAQQQRLSLLQRLLTASSPEVRHELLKQEENLVDADLFNMLSRLQETAAMTGDQESVKRLEEVQADLLENTEFGRQVRAQSEEVQAAVQSLQEAGKELTREKLLDIVIKAPTDIRLNALVSLARPAMDYTFFQLLSERIDRARDKGRERLIQLRERLLELTRQFDAQMEARAGQARKLLEDLLQSENITEAAMQNLPAIDEFFLQALNSEMEAARESGDLERIGKLQQIVNVLQQASAPPPEIALVEELLDAPDEQATRQLLEAHKDQITPEFLQMLAGLQAQVEQSDQDPELVKRLQGLGRQARRFSMEKNLRGE
jgi:hypothetical protein